LPTLFIQKAYELSEELLALYETAKRNGKIFDKVTVMKYISIHYTEYHKARYYNYLVASEIIKPLPPKLFYRNHNYKRNPYIKVDEKNVAKLRRSLDSLKFRTPHRKETDWE